VSAQLRDDTPGFRLTYKMLDRLWDASESVRQTAQDSLQFGAYVGTAWKSIYKSLVP
jgi:hypothetical protein